MAADHQLRAQPDVVEDLPVKHEHELAILARHWLARGGRQVEDREAPEPKPERPVDVHTPRVGTAMKQTVAHPFDDGLIHGAFVEPKDGGDATHVRFLPPVRTWSPRGEFRTSPTRELGPYLYPNAIYHADLVRIFTGASR